MPVWVGAFSIAHSTVAKAVDFLWAFPLRLSSSRLDTPIFDAHYLDVLFHSQWRSTLKPSRPQQLTKTINEWGSVLEAVQRLTLQLLGMIALIYLVGRVIMR
jgi:hypothetical protein